ncbi:hypothetical protein DB313_05415 (plasmid) [Borrelia turcica IST7]|uniref:Uncharacterized protein n=1 Tax=Borrelia turcica IST7 TaxID=1104446 RepID=A0A386PPS5_9SPIR|nr:hypothetical protein [Borrelia turcica]AYE36939.1 hypothetical protein DB313_05415 [Borrelia turcica IST7]
MGYKEDVQFDFQYENINKLKNNLELLCDIVRGYLGGNLSKITVDGLQKDAVTKAIDGVVLINKTLARIKIIAELVFLLYLTN